MGYEIVYGKKFIRTSDNRYIPMILSGSSNCTMFCNSKEIRERSWGVWNDDIAFKTKDEILAWVDEKMAGCDHELFKERSNWICGKDIHRWFENAINKANTFDEIFAENPYRSIECFVWSSHKTSYGDFKSYMYKCVKTEEALIAWLDEAKKFIEGADQNYHYYIHYGFSGIEPISVSSKKTGKVIVKFGNQYLSEYDSIHFTTCSDKADALVFDSVEAFREVIKDAFFKHYHYRLINA